MASPSSRSNGLITCDLCENSAKKFCDCCQVSLCAKCVHKHVKKFKSQTHDIVPIKDRTTLVLPDCEFHSNQRCEAQCQQCDVPVCIKCIINSHNGHSITDMLKFFIGKKEEIREETQEIESSILPMYEKKTFDIGINMAYRTEDYMDLEIKSEEHRQLWHQEVDIIFDKFLSSIKSMKDRYREEMNLQKKSLEEFLIPKLKQIIQQNKEILKSNRVSDITNYKSEVMKCKKDYDFYGDLDINEQAPFLITGSPEGRKLYIELDEYKARLTQGPELFAKAREIATFPTEDGETEGRRRGRYPSRVACVGEDKAWISYNDKTLRCFDLHGTVHETLTTKCQKVEFSVTSSDELIYIDPENKTVNKVDQGKTEVLITLPKDWEPKSLSCTSDNILVNLEKDGQNKIVSFQGQTVKQEIYRDKKNREIFGRGCSSLIMAKNGNGDLCVADLNASIVVVLTKAGRVRFRYDGTPAMRDEEFLPDHIVTDSRLKIIVGDFFNNYCLHILDQHGQFLQCVDDFGVNEMLSRVSGMSVDLEDRLWIIMDYKKVKVIQVYRKDCTT
ncbi:E3 ubiquitin-protein ligase TRIM45-like [Saccostrea cucullata]|uniref:E3 ubiquitin-protein ligase TRIM45-like n=1 Tax=Saccostrea cuccullata TaxID=36930 RepID=UPI002ED002F5